MGANYRLFSYLNDLDYIYLWDVIRILTLLLAITLLQACESSSSQSGYLKFYGPTMGTSYNITCGPTKDAKLKVKIDSLLVDLNQELSTYIENSTISKFNQRGDSIYLDDYNFFNKNINECMRIYVASDGYFDPTVMPLVNYWGFGYEEKRPVEKVDSVVVDSLLNLVGFFKMNLKDGFLKKLVPNLQLDFSALAKGFAVDEIGRLLNKEGVANYLIEIGGEVLVKGKNPNNQDWKLGISMPKENASAEEMALAIVLNNQGMATSGNYRIFYKGDGYNYAHTINPKTGYPEKSNLLSATVVANNCMSADGFATAFMAMGMEKAYALAMRMTDIEALFLYTDENGMLKEKSTPAMQAMIKH